MDRDGDIGEDPRKLKEEIQKLRQQLRKANETAQLRMDNIAAQKREIADLRQQLAEGGNGASVPSASIGVDVSADIIMALSNNYKKDKEKAKRLCYWLGFGCTLLEIFKSISINDTSIDSAVTSKLPDLERHGIDLEKPVTPTDALRSLPGPVRAVRLLEMITRDIYNHLLTAFCKNLDQEFIPVIIDQAHEPLDKLELVVHRKGSVRQPLTQLLTEILRVLQANRICSIIAHQFFTQVFYFINCRLFNTLLKRPELCTCGFGFNLRYAVSELTTWMRVVGLSEFEEPWLQPGRQLARIQDAASVLVLSKSYFDEAKVSDLEQTLASLSIFDIKYLLDSYMPDKVSTERVPVSVKRKLEAACSKEKSPPSSLELDPFALPSRRQLSPRNSGPAPDDDHNHNNNNKGKGKEKEKEKKTRKKFL